MNIVIVIGGVIPAAKYGGTERVIWYLGKELSKIGHKVTFLAAKGSVCPFAKVIELDPYRSIDTQIPDYADVVHFNGNVPSDFNKPYVVTMHGNMVSENMDPNIIFVSRNHAQRFGCNSFVCNGLDWDDYGKADLSRRRSGYHFLGNAAWKLKNIKGAIDVTRSLRGERLEVLGGYRLNLKMGMRFTISPKIKFRGMVGDDVKKEVLEQSKGLIFPVMWHEPFGLAIIESLYFGAPVFGTPYGSLPEIVNSEVGFLTNDAQELIAHLKEGHVYSPKICNEYVLDKFNSKIMAEEYLKKYEQVLLGNPLIDTSTSKPDRNYANLVWKR